MIGEERFVVSRRKTGWGDCFVSAISAWHYARRTGRTLVIDWRRSLYLSDPHRNAFAAYFEPVTRIGGVRVIADDSVGELVYPCPTYESLGRRALRGVRFWLASRGLAPSSEQRAAAYHQGHAEECALLEQDDRPEPTVFLHTSLSEGLPDRASCREFLEALVPLPPIRADIERFTTTSFAGGPVVGVHVRYGSRAMVDTHSPYWEDENRALEDICFCIERVAGELGATARVFLCTDRRDVEDAVRARVPGLITRGKYFHDGGTHELHSWLNPEGLREEVGRDALIEMFLLARTNALVCYPPHSFFSFYARTCVEGPCLPAPDL